MAVVRRQLEAAEGEWHAVDDGYVRALHAATDLGWVMLLTACCAASVSGSLSYGGQSIEGSLWSLAFVISLIVLIYVGGLAAVVGTPPGTSSLAVYRRLMVVMLIIAVLPLFQQTPSAAPHRRKAPLSDELVPSWWPLSAGRRPDEG